MSRLVSCTEQEREREREEKRERANPRDLPSRDEKISHLTLESHRSRLRFFCARCRFTAIFARFSISRPVGGCAHTLPLFHLVRRTGPRRSFGTVGTLHVTLRALASRSTITRDIIYIDAPHRFVIPFLPSLVMSSTLSFFPRPDPPRSSELRRALRQARTRFFCASFAQNLVSIPSRKRRRSPIIERRAAKAA